MKDDIPSLLANMPKLSRRDPGTNATVLIYFPSTSGNSFLSYLHFSRTVPADMNQKLKSGISVVLAPDLLALCFSGAG